MLNFQVDKMCLMNLSKEVLSKRSAEKHPRDPSIQIISKDTYIGPKVCNYYLHWIGRFGSIGICGMSIMLDNAHASCNIKPAACKLAVIGMQFFVSTVVSMQGDVVPTIPVPNLLMYHEVAPSHTTCPYCGNCLVT